MKAEKTVIGDLTLCYCVAPLMYKGEQHFLVASEKEHACLLFDKNGKQVDKVWDGPGGTMTIVQIPGSDGAFLATHQFYSPNNSKEAKIVLCNPSENGWQVRTLADLPFIHRFDILSRDGINYILACCLKSDYEYKDDWRFPGMTLTAVLPDDWMALPDDFRLEFTVLRKDMLKNHGYSRDVEGGINTGIVACDDGIYRFTPPASAGQWKIEKLLSEPASDALLIDFDGDGDKELLTLAPFHGDTLNIYKKQNGVYERVFEYESRIEFAHAICQGEIESEKLAFIGHRKGARNLLAVRYQQGEYMLELLDHDVGPANVWFFSWEDKNILISANREINEIAYYTISI